MKSSFNLLISISALLEDQKGIERSNIEPLIPPI